MSAETQSARLAVARRSAAFAASPWSDADLVTDQHSDPIFFGNGAPAAEIEPVERLAEGARQAWAVANGHLDYGEVAGFSPLRELILDRLEQRGIHAAVDDLMITSGSQQGIDLIAKLMLDPGDGVVVEGPTYIGAMQVFDAYEAQYFVSPVDRDGMCMDTLEQLLANEANRIKLIYTMPTFQNPTGSNMASVRRTRLLELARRHNVLVVEDDPYGEIYFGVAPERALRADDRRVVYLGTFSKIIAPGVRVGWMVAPPELMPMLLLAKEGADINSNRIMTRTIYFAARDFIDEHIARIREFYRARSEAMIEALGRSAPDDIQIATISGGFFAWCNLPPGESAEALLRVAAKHGVGFLPGSWFFPEGHQSHTGLRLSYSALPVERIVEGATRLGNAMTEYQANR